MPFVKFDFPREVLEVSEGGKHGGRLKAVGHAYIGDPDIVPNSDTKDRKNEFTKVKLYYDKIPEDLLK